MADQLAKDLVRRARTNAGLTQRQLAVRANTAQSLVARTELGENSPSWDTLIRLLHAAGHTIEVTLERTPVVDPSLLEDVPRILAMTPQQRLEEVANVSRFTASARRA